MVAMSLPLGTLFAALSLPSAFAHSWLECADYTGDLTNFQAGDYDVTACNGFPRPLDGGARGVGRQQFGQDIGMDKQTRRNDASPQCHVGPTTAAQYGSFPMAQYQQGKSYTLAWPAKNHAAAECTNANIPDTGLKIFAAKVDGALGAGADPVHSELQLLQIPASFSDKPADSPFEEGWGQGHAPNTVDYQGFQKCLDFCSNTDKAFCHGDVTIPANMEVGTYTMQWYWEFNQGQIYMTCFDVEVVAADEETTGTGGGGNGGNNASTLPVTPIDSTCDVEPGTNMIDFLSLPKTMSSSSSMFSVELCYAASTTVEIVVEALDAETGAHLGYGHAEVSATGETETKERIVFVEMRETPRAGSNTVLIRAWNADKADYRRWQSNIQGANISSYELTRRETVISVSDGASAAFRASGNSVYLLNLAIALLSLAFAANWW